MDIICAKCGKHFNSIEAAREHRGHCKVTSNGDEIHWLPAKKDKQNKWIPAKRSELTKSELEDLNKLVDSLSKKPSVKEPDTKSSAEELASEEPDIKEPDFELSVKETDTEKAAGVVGGKVSYSLKKIFSSRVWTANYKIESWFLALLLIFALSIVGFGISTIVGTFIPFWILMGFSLIFSVEYWFYYQTRKRMYIGRLYKSCLNISILSLLGLIIWSGIQLFSKQFIQSPLTGSIIFIVELVFFVWLLRVVHRNRRRWPSMKLTVFVLLVAFIILAFAGVNPFNSYKDAIISGISNVFSSLNTSGDTAKVDEVPSDISITFDNYINENAGFSIDYPRDWDVSGETVLDSGERLRVSFDGVINGEDNKISVCGLTDSYGYWFSIFNSPQASTRLVIEESYINGAKYSKFYQDIEGEETLIYLFDCKEGSLLISWSFPSKSLSGYVIDSYIQDMFKSFSIIPSQTFNINNNGVYANYFLGLVKTPDGVISGSGCYGEFIVLINNSEAKNSTYSELLDFLRTDKTDEFPYQYNNLILGFYFGDAEDKIDLIWVKGIIDGALQPENPRICADFAERLHNNAELAGIRCGFVSLDMTGYTDPFNLGIASDSGHACNVFETTDRGLIYIDCTGIIGNYGPANNDTIVKIQIGQQYNQDFLFPSGGWYIPSGVMGVVTDMFVTWDGDWR